MAQRTGQPRTLTSVPIIGAVAIISSAFILTRFPIESERPPAPQGMRLYDVEQHRVDARLWQDPLKAATDHKRSAHPLSGDPNEVCISDHCVNQITDVLADVIPEAPIVEYEGPPKVHMLLLLIRDGPSAEDYERRVRNRYAVHAGLRSSGMTPRDTRYIQYFELPDDEARFSAAAPILVPFEWFDREPLCPAHRDDQRPEQLLVVWLPQSPFAGEPLTRLSNLLVHMVGPRREAALRHMIAAPPAEIRVDLIGPSRSALLRDMLREIDPNSHAATGEEPPPFGRELEGLTIFSPWSTASPLLLAPHVDLDAARMVRSSQDLLQIIPERFKKCAGINFIRMVGPDDFLARELILELRRRDIDILPTPAARGDHVALITERDTYYSRALQLVFTTMMECIDPASNELDWADYALRLQRREPCLAADLPSNLHVYAFASGTDGRLHGSDKGPDTPRDKSPEIRSLWLHSEAPERPTGRAQIDYIRRLVQDIQLQQMRDERIKLRAIGIFSSDVYDKLALLHALREEVKGATLFATDFDARLLQREHFQWTRNVIVASSYGQELNQQYYSRSLYTHSAPSAPVAAEFSRMLPDEPPFRDNYQAALFLACRATLGLEVAVRQAKRSFRDLGSDDAAWLFGEPRILEIGRTQAVDLSPNTSTTGLHRPRFHVRGWRSLRNDIWYGPLGRAIRTGLILLPVAVVVYLLLRPAKRPTERVVAERVIEKILRVLAGLLVSAFLIVAVIDHYFRPTGEPFSIWTGVSAWPGEALRLLAIILGGYFIVRATRTVMHYQRELGGEFLLDQSPRRQTGGSRAARSRGWIVRALLALKEAGERVTSVNLKQVLKATARFFHNEWWFVFGYDRHGRISARREWKEHVRRGQLWKRMLRSTLWAVAYLLVIFLPLAGGTLGYRPYRGLVSIRSGHTLLVLSGITTILLVFYVVDAFWLCLHITRALIDHETVWPLGLLRTQIKSVDADIPVEANVHDIRFIEKLTEAVGPLIYYPFIVLLALILARHSYFDNWDFPPTLAILYIASMAFLAACALMLQHEARLARRTALMNLRRALYAAERGPRAQQRKVASLNSMIEEVESTRRGAFRPLAENPVLGALLIPPGGLSLITLISYLASS